MGTQHVRRDYAIPCRLCIGNGALGNDGDIRDVLEEANERVIMPGEDLNVNVRQ